MTMLQEIESATNPCRVAISKRSGLAGKHVADAADKANAAMLITLDVELLTRAGVEITAMTPAGLVAAQAASSPPPVP